MTGYQSKKAAAEAKLEERSMIEAMKQALEALEVANSCVDGYYIPKGKTHLPEVEEAIKSLRWAIAEAEKPRLDRGRDYEEGFIDGMQHQMQSSVDKAVNAVSRKPLTDEEIFALLAQTDEFAVRLPRGLRDFARAIEAAHGIKEKA